VQPANRTTPGLFVKILRFWGYADYKEHDWGSGFKGSRFRVMTSSAISIITPKSPNLQISNSRHLITFATN
jgi:hypothetical protein